MAMKNEERPFNSPYNSHIQWINYILIKSLPELFRLQ